LGILANYWRKLRSSTEQDQKMIEQIAQLN
jgi:hypothetical protein